MDKFQSLLIIGSKHLARSETAKIARSLGINLDKPSPDIQIISPIKNTVQIEQIRDLKKNIFQKPLREKFKITVIEEAQKLTAEAQNALLKILEEPPAHSVIILESSSKEEILPTILSRVITLRTSESLQAEELSLIKEQDSLEVLNQIEDYEDFLNSQITAAFSLLVKKIKGEKISLTGKKLIDTIERARETKTLIKSNVNPTFATASLLISLNFDSPANQK